jgi:hypothetical protein
MQARILAPLFVAAVAASAFAGEATLTAIPAPEGAPRTVHEAVQLLRAHRAARAARPATSAKSAKSARMPGRIRPNVIEYETGDSAFLAINDFVGTKLGVTGLGALLIIGFDSTGKTFDDNAFIDGFSRIWTPQPGSVGTVSQSFPSVSLFDSASDFTAFALGLRQDAGFRTNVGVVNLDTVVHTWTITSLITSKTITLDVQPFSLGQTGVPADFAGTSGNLSIAYDVNATDFFWSAYASSVDNVTGDGWVSRATQ